MNYQSDQIGELATALCKAQGEFPKIPKTKKVDFTNKDGKRTFYTYADLADVIEAVKPILTKCGLSYSQDLRVDDHGKILLWTTLMHSSGEWKTGSFPVGLGAKHQETGSNITYVRRYTLSAALGIQSEEDNDAQLIEKAMTTTAPKAFGPKFVVPPRTELIAKNPWILDPPKLQRLKEMKEQAAFSKNEVVKLCKKIGISSILDMNQSQYDLLCNELTLHIAMETHK